MIMTWAGIWANQTHGPYFFSGKVIEKLYLHILQNFLGNVSVHLWCILVPKERSTNAYVLTAHSFLNTKKVHNIWTVWWHPTEWYFMPLNLGVGEEKGHFKSTVHEKHLRPNKNITTKCTKIIKKVLLMI